MEWVLISMGVCIVIAAVSAALAHDRIRNMQKELRTYKEKNAQVMNRIYGDNRFEIGYVGELIDNCEKEYL